MAGLGDSVDAKHIAEYAESITDLDIWNEGLNIEDIFTHLEIDLERTSTFELHNIRQSLLKIIQALLAKLESSVIGKGNEFQNLAKRLKGTQDTVLTFNWDLLLDNALNRQMILKNYDRGTGESTVPGPYGNFVNDLSGISERTYAHSTVQSPHSEWIRFVTEDCITPART